MTKQILLAILILNVLLTGCKEKNQNDSNTNGNYNDYEIYDSNSMSIDKLIMENNPELTLINFWATYCAPCKKEIPDLIELQNEYKNELLIIGASVDTEENSELLKKMVKLFKMNYPVIYGLKSEYKTETIAGLPTSILLDKDMNIIEIISGKREYNFFKDLIDKTLSSNTNNTEEISNIEQDFYDLEYTTIKETNMMSLKITISLKDKYYFNGEGYPPMKVSFYSDDKLTFSPAEFSIDGIAAGESKTITTSITGFTEETTIKLLLDYIACSDTMCKPKKDNIELDI